MARYMFGGFQHRMGQIRWQLALCYLLAGALSVLLVAAFALTAANMLVLRGSINTIERQLALFVELSENRLELLTTVPQGESRPRVRRFPGSHMRVLCPGDKQTETPLSMPPWLAEDRFAGMTFSGPQAVIRAYVRKKSGDCQVEAIVESPVDGRVTGLISRASGLDLDYRPPPPNAPSSARPPAPPKGPPSLSMRLWYTARSYLATQFAGALPVFVAGHDWETGEILERPVFFVHPNQLTVLRQLTRFGQRQALWVWVLAILAGLFLVVEAAALVIAVRLARRVVRSVDQLSVAAEAVGAGHLDHRIPVKHDDQLGRLGQRFNHMAESLQKLVAETRERERLEEELRLARQVQESLYPRMLPQSDSTKLAAVCLPARNVSGDLYDVIDLGNGRYGLLCADVSGKGISAALLTANLQAIVRSMLYGANGVLPSPSELVARINAEVCRNIPGNRFITLFWADYNEQTRQLRWTSAGHCPALVLLPGHSEPIWLGDGGMPVGVFCSAKYSDQEMTLPSGTMLVAYTDGVPEAERPDGEELGADRLAWLCVEKGDGDPPGLIEHLIAGVRHWTGGVEPGDDLTLLVMRAG